MSWKKADTVSFGAALEPVARSRLTLLRPRHQVQQHAPARRREAPGRHDGLAPLTGADALGDAVDEQVDDLVLAQVPRGEVLVVPPQLLAELGHRRARQQPPPVVGAKGVLDVAHRQAPRQHLDGQLLQRLGPALGVLADLGAERLVPPGDLRRGELDRPLRRLGRPVRQPLR